MDTARKVLGALAGCAVLLGSAAFVASVAAAAQDKYAVKVPGGLAFARKTVIGAARRWSSAAPRSPAAPGSPAPSETATILPTPA